MGIYKTPYLKFEFSNSKINFNLFEELKKTKKDDLILSIKKFREKEISNFKSDYKFERICLIIGRVLFLLSMTSIILELNFENMPAEIFGPGLLLIFPTMFLLSLSYSYALSLRELKKAINKRKKNLIQAHKFANESTNFDEFIKSITLN